MWRCVGKRNNKLKLREWFLSVQVRNRFENGTFPVWKLENNAKLTLEERTGWRTSTRRPVAGPAPMDGAAAAARREERPPPSSPTCSSTLHSWKRGWWTPAAWRLHRVLCPPQPLCTLTPNSTERHRRERKSNRFNECGFASRTSFAAHCSLPYCCGVDRHANYEELLESHWRVLKSHPSVEELSKPLKGS